MYVYMSIYMYIHTYLLYLHIVYDLDKEAEAVQEDSLVSRARGTGIYYIYVYTIYI